LSAIWVPETTITAVSVTKTNYGIQYQKLCQMSTRRTAGVYIVT